MRRAPMLASIFFLFGGASLFALWSGGLFHATSTAAYHESFEQYCFRCHGPTMPQGGVNLRLLDFDNLDANGAIWEKVLRKLRSGEMPPAGRWRPDSETYAELVKYVEDGREHIAETHPNPGRITLHRLNRVEYANAIRDLLAIDIDSAEMLPADDIGYGFDNIGDVLNLSPVLLDRYLVAAGRISRLATGDVLLPATFQTYEVPHGLVQVDRMGADTPLGSRGGASFRHYFPVDADYDIAIQLQRGRFDGVMGLERDRDLDVRVDGKRVKLFHIAADPKGGGLGLDHDPNANLKVRIPVTAGAHTIVAAFLKDTILQEGVPPRQVERAFFEGVGGVSIAGPYDTRGPGATESRRRIFTCQANATISSDDCARTIITALARRAYRRPVEADDVTQLLGLYKHWAAEGGFETGIRLALQKILVSPEFIFRVEYDPPGVKPGANYRVSDVELASRLSFFLWSTIPDDELLGLAEQGKLSDPRILEAQTRRMLADPRSRSLVTNFAGQWLYLRNVTRIQPDPQAFPAFDENLRRAMREETERVIETTIREDRPVADLLDTDFTFVNERLARHYGIDGVYGAAFRRIQITDPNRRGLLGQASILAVTSYPNRTAPTLRGKWVMEQILGSPPPPPPANVPSLKDDATTRNMNMRERMEQHRANPTCAVCHVRMDPLGFSLENFDGLGRWREATGGVAIDSSGVLPDGTKFDGPHGLRDILLSRKDSFVETFTERLMTYALGRGVEEYDEPTIRKVVREAKSNGDSWSAIILGIVKSTPFQMRRVSDDHI